MPYRRTRTTPAQRMAAAKAAYAKRKARRSRARPSSLVSTIKNLSLANCETKIASQSADGVNLYHNVTLYVPNLLKTKQSHNGANNPGTERIYNRIGNEVIARGLKLRLQWICDPQHPNMNLKFFVFRYETGALPADSTFWVGPAGAGANQNRMIDFVDTREVKLLKSFTIQNRNKLPVDAGEHVNNVYKDVWIPLNNRKIKYDGNNSEDPKYTTIGMACVAFDANNTLQSDIIQYFSYTSRFYFKDP